MQFKSGQIIILLMIQSIFGQRVVHVALSMQG